jgi:type III secretion protein L
MSPDEPTTPTAPTFKPLGPVVRGHEVDSWGRATEALESVVRYHGSVQAFADETYQREKQRGYDEGLAAGAAEAARLIAAAAARAEQHMDALERELPGLVGDIVERMLGTFDTGDLLLHAVHHALGQLRSRADVYLRVAPEHAESLRQTLAEFGSLKGAGRVHVEVDPAMERGACMLCSELGNVELGIAAQVRALREGLEVYAQRTTADSGTVDALTSGSAASG